MTREIFFIMNPNNLNSIHFKKTCVAIATVLVVNYANAYEVLTHEQLTSIAIQKSVVVRDPSIFNRLGFPAATSSQYFPKSKILNQSQRSAIDTIAQGAIWEDDRYDNVVYNHFFDPQFNNRQGRGLQILHINGIPSPDWVLSDRTPYPIDLNNPLSAVSPENPYRSNPQGYSYRDANVAFYKALTALEPVVRRDATGLALQSIGHVTHHIQDMAQPQHVRNDPHLHRTGYPGILSFPNGTYSGAARYELSTEKKSQAEILALVEVAESKGWVLAQPPKFATARQYFHGPATGVNYTGMADYTAQNYVTQATSSYPLPAAGFDLPSMTNGDGSSKYVGPDPNANTRSLLVNGTTYQIQDNYLIGKAFDGWTGRSEPMLLYKFGMPAHRSINTQSKRPAGYEDEKIFDERRRLLLPRAISFSAGLINHFFRGNVSITQAAPDGKTWTFTNNGDTPLVGELTLLSEDALGNRSSIAPFIVNLASGASQTLTLPSAPLQGTTKVVAAFRGKIGEEGDATLASGYYSVTGALGTYTPAPLVGCSDLRFSSGYYSGNGRTDIVTYDKIMTLGSTPGLVLAQFLNGSSNSLMTITANGGSGRLLLQLPIRIAGRSPQDAAVFAFDSSIENTTSVKIHANNAGPINIDVVCASNNRILERNKQYFITPDGTVVDMPSPPALLPGQQAAQNVIRQLLLDED